MFGARNYWDGSTHYRKQFVKIAVVGGGIFGCIAAWKLGLNGHEVVLYEKAGNLLTAASGINQYRLHRGYHYPRSPETISSCIEGERQFREAFEDCVMCSHSHIYGIAKEGSHLTARQCTEIWDKNGLGYCYWPIYDITSSDAFDSAFRVEEAVFDVIKLREICWEILQDVDVDVRLRKEATPELLEKYDFKVIATYAMGNALLPKESQIEYQFELVEKLVLKLPEKYQNVSFVVQDGPFTCIDPFGATGLTLMGNVVCAIHHSNVGVLPSIPEEFVPFLNKGIVRNPPITNVKLFLDAAEKFFPGIKSCAKHVGSMYTIRTVLPRREHDDARPTIVRKVSDDMVSVFSGKIPTCISAADEVVSCVQSLNAKEVV